MFRTILYLIALIVVFYFVFRKRKPEPSKLRTRLVDRTLDPNYPRAFISCRPWSGKSRGATPLRTPQPPQNEA